jgi:hypothetical protein
VSGDPFDQLYRDLFERIRSSTGLTVQSGLFAGMRLAEGIAWGNGDFITKLLGCYEQEIAGALSEVVAWRPDMIVNVGCAEGFYAVGMARLVPDVPVFAFDAYAPALTICREAAALNGIVDRITYGDRCSADQLARTIQSAARPFLLLDCEGAELELLSGAPAEAFARAMLLVECHDFDNRAITPALLKRFRSTHAVARIEQGARDPNQYPELRGWHEHWRWLAMSESRPETMHWLFITPR